MGNNIFNSVKGFKKINPEYLIPFKEKMEKTIPKIVEIVRKRQILASKIRNSPLSSTGKHD